jgi:hypothetical protein
VNAAAKPVYSSTNFTETEAMTHIGKTVRLLAAVGEIPPQAIGHVIDFHQQSRNVFYLVIRWDAPDSAQLYQHLGRDKYHRLVSEE